MERRQSILGAIAIVALLAVTACAISAPAAEPETVSNVEPVIIEWHIGPKGGLGEGSAFVTQASWEPKKLEVPVNQPFIIRFVPRDNITKDTIVFSSSLEEATGVKLEDLVVSNGQPAETPVMVIKSEGKSFDVFSREHRGVGGFGSIVTPGG